MNLNVELGDELGAVLQAHAQAQGVSPDRLVRQVLEDAFGGEIQPTAKPQPLKSGRGMFAKYGQAPSAEEIDETAARCSATLPKIFNDRQHGCDTHTALWSLYNDARLSMAAGSFIDRAAEAGQQPTRIRDLRIVPLHQKIGEFLSLMGRTKT